MWGGDGWGGWLFGAIMMVVFWGGLIAIAFVLVRTFAGRSDGDRPADGGSTARRLLEERFARGEISVEEFEERRRVLEHSGT